MRLFQNISDSNPLNKSETRKRKSCPDFSELKQLNPHEIGEQSLDIVKVPHCNAITEPYQILRKQYGLLLSAELNAEFLIFSGKESIK